jgi:hypothetical protein
VLLIFVTILESWIGVSAGLIWTKAPGLNLFLGLCFSHSSFTSSAMDGFCVGMGARRTGFGQCGLQRKAPALERSHHHRQRARHGCTDHVGADTLGIARLTRAMTDERGSLIIHTPIVASILCPNCSISWR